MNKPKLEALKAKLSIDYSFHFGASNKDYLIIKSSTQIVKIAKQTLIDHNESKIPIMVKEYAEVKHFDSQFTNHLRVRRMLKKEYKFLVFFADNGDLLIKSEAQEIRIDKGFWVNMFKEEK